MTDRFVVSDASVLTFAPHIVFRFDEVRKRWVILAPERLMLPDEQAVEILKFLDGKTGVSAIVDSLRANQTDFALFNDPTVATLVPNEQGMTLNRIPGLAYNVLQLNPSRPPMDNQKVRQAISCAVNLSSGWTRWPGCRAVVYRSKRTCRTWRC